MAQTMVACCVTVLCGEGSHAHLSHRGTDTCGIRTRVKRAFCMLVLIRMAMVELHPPWRATALCLEATVRTYVAFALKRQASAS